MDKRALQVIFVCYKWKSRGYRSIFKASAVNTLLSMLRRHYHAPLELVCVTDDAEGIDPSVRIIPLWSDYADVPSPHGAGNPSCYRRLKMFSAEAAEFIGPRFVSLDLDVVICSDITELLSEDCDIRIYADPNPQTPYNGSIIQHRAGTRTQLWDTFTAKESPKLARRLGFIGSDQAWLAVCLGPNERRFTTEDGVYSFRFQIETRNRGRLPDDAKIVVMHGCTDPWSAHAQARCPWIKEHYR